jgi:hypothetical protein
MNAQLKKDLKYFLDTYLKFELIDSKSPNLITLIGVIDIVDIQGSFWKSYNIAIVFNENKYPYVAPQVYELSKHIDRNWDSHISEKGNCCINIPHKLIQLERIGIELTRFYQSNIYPFFANHQFKLIEGKYANGEYQHFDCGIIQFYKEEFGLTEPKIIIKHLELALGITKANANKECPICGKPKYKKCCRPNVNKLLIYGTNRLQLDLMVFNNE